MSMMQAILHGKEHRKPFRGAARFDSSCRHHGGCSYCQCNRMFFDHKKRVAAGLDLKGNNDVCEEETS